jgi:tetratricopeptide (TPR) repeat protein
VVKTVSPLSFYLRILFVGLFVTLLGLGPIPRAAGTLLSKAHQAMAGSELLNTANDLAGAASYFPWRYDMNITAAQYAYQAGDYKSTIQFLERPGTVSHLTPADLILLGDAYQQSGNSPMAVAIWKRVAELGEVAPATQRLADLYLQRKDYYTAASYLQQLLLTNPSNVQLYYQIGELYSVTDPTKALPFLAQAAQMDTADATKAHALHDKIRTANLFDEPAYTALIVGRQLADWGQWELAEAAFQQAISLQPGYAEAWAFMGEARQQVALQETKAVADVGRPQLELALQLDSSSVAANTLMGLYWERQEDYSRAEIYLEHAISLSSKDPYLYSELGNILSKGGDLPAAQSAYESAIQHAPQDPLFYRQLAQFALDNHIQIREMALPAARQAVLMAPDDAASLDLMAQVMLMLVDYQTAERFSMSAIQADPQYAPAYLHLGTAYLYQGQVDLAQVWLSQAEMVGSNSWVAGQATRMLAYYFPK